MDVCDVGGDKIGTVAHIHRFSELPDPEDTSTMPEEYIEVKTGLFGLGKHYFIPMSLIQEVLTDSLYVDKSKEELATAGFETRPEHLPEAH